MLYHLTDYLSHFWDIPGVGMFSFISFRAAMSIIVALIIAMIFGKKIIKILQRKQIGEDVRNLGLQGQLEKKGTPTMGGVIILLAILVPVILFCNLTNIYIQLLIISTIWLGIIGFLDDYIKVFRKNKDGLKGRFKIFGQVGLGLIIGITMWINSDIVVKENVGQDRYQEKILLVDDAGDNQTVYLSSPNKTPITTIPFVKNNELDYSDLIPGSGHHEGWGWVVYVLLSIIVIAAVSNGANLTDGLDGLAAGTSAIIGVVLGILAYVSGNVIYSNYLNIMYIPGSGEIFVFCASLVGALIGFLWYNSYPAQVFMGDTGSLAVGGVIAVVALLIRKELLIPILCGVFLMESLSVIVQVGWFKYTKNIYGEGRRLLLMAPLHHHYQKKGYFEVKIVTRFWIVQLLLAAITLITLKIR